jgi:hypothetical protein
VKRLTGDERKMYSEKIVDLANIGSGALIFGQSLGEVKFSWWLLLTGLAFWFICLWVSHTLYPGSDTQVGE